MYLCYNLSASAELKGMTCLQVSVFHSVSSYSVRGVLFMCICVVFCQQLTSYRVLTMCHLYCTQLAGAQLQRILCIYVLYSVNIC